MKPLFQTPLAALAGQTPPASCGDPGKAWHLLAQAGQISRLALAACSALAIGLGGLSLLLGGCPHAAGTLASGLCGLALARLTRAMFCLPPASR